MVVTMQRPPSVHEVAFAGVPGEVGAARQWATAVSGLTGDDAATLGLLVSELATNSVLHSRSGHPDGAYTVTVEALLESVRVVVTDSGPQPERPTVPVPRQADPWEVGGKGLCLVRALAHAWGARSSTGRTEVWFELRNGDGSHAA